MSITALTCEAEKLMDLTAWLHEREHILVSIDDEEVMDSFMFSVLRSVQAIRFAQEWNVMTTQPGGKKWKGKYCKKAFEEAYPGSDRTDYVKEFCHFHMLRKSAPGRIKLLGHGWGGDNPMGFSTNIHT